MWKPNLLATAGCIAVILGTFTAGTIYVGGMLFFWFWLPAVLFQYVLWFVLAKKALNRNIIRPMATVVAFVATVALTPISAKLPYWLTAIHMVRTVDETPLPRQTDIMEVVADPVINLDMGSTVTFRLHPKADVLELLQDYVLVLENSGWEKWRGEVPSETGRNVLLNFSDRSGAQSYGHIEITAAWNGASEAFDLIEVRRTQSSNLPEVMFIVIFSFGIIAIVIIAAREDKEELNS